MKTFTVEQAKYNLKWHKSMEMQMKNSIDQLSDHNATYFCKPTVFHTRILDEQGKLCAFYSRPTYEEAVAIGKEVVGEN